MNDRSPLARLTPDRPTVWRFVLFGIVAVGGLLVQLFVLSLLYRFLGLNYTIALALSVVLAMTFNFAVHNVLTFGDRSLKGAATIKGWLSFCLACAVGGLLNMFVATFFYKIGWHWALSGLLGAGAGGLVNFGLASRYTWKSDDR